MLLGPKCETNIDECESNPCPNGERCVDQIDGYQCVSDCHTTCMHGGTCMGGICACPTGWTGPQCNQDINECLNRTICNNGACYNNPGGYTCGCYPGWIGANCDFQAPTCKTGDCPIDYCEIAKNVTGQQPCKNGGTCINMPEQKMYRCACPCGWYGRYCDVNPNDCGRDNPCINGGTCVGK